MRNALSLVAVLFASTAPGIAESPDRLIRVLGRHDGPVHCLVFSPDGKVLASGGPDVRLWDLTTGKERCRIKLDPPYFKPNGLAFSPDGKTLAAAGTDGALWLWDTATGKPLRSIGKPKQPACVFAVAFSPDGKLVACSDSFDWVRIWDLASGKMQTEYHTGREWILFSADSRTVISANLGQVVIADAATGKALHRFIDKPYWGRVTGETYVAKPVEILSADGRHLVLAAHREGQLWEVATGKAVGQFHLDGWTANGFVSALSADNRTLAVVHWADDSPLGKGDRTIRLMELASGKQRQEFAGQSHVCCLCFSPQGTALAVSREDGTVRLLDLRIPDSVRSKVDDIESFWNDLAGTDAHQANRAMWSLVAHPRQTIKFVRNQGATLVSPLDGRQVAQLLTELDSDRFGVREKAFQELCKQGRRVRPALEAALKGNPPAEVRQRIENLLDSLAGKTEYLKFIRAVEVLEQIGSAESRQLLEQWEEQAADETQKADLRAALARLTQRAAAAGAP